MKKIINENQILKKFSKAKHTQKLVNILLSEMENLGFQYILLAVYEDEEYIFPNNYDINTYPEIWHTFYHKNKCFLTDPILKLAFEKRTSFFWHDVMNHKNFTDSDNQFFAYLKKFGHLDGYVITIIEPDQSLSVYSLSSKKMLTPDPKEKNTLDLIMKSFHKKFRELTPYHRMILPKPYKDLDSKIILSHRERECLSWAAHGKSAYEIGLILGITQKTVTFHWNNVRKKLNVMNMQQATAKAVAMDLIRI